MTNKNKTGFANFAKTLIAAGVLFINNGLYSQSFPQTGLRSLPDAPAYSPNIPGSSSKTNDIPAFPESDFSLEVDESRFLIQNEEGYSELEKVVDRTAKRSEVILRDRIESEPNLWFYRENSRWDSDGERLIENSLKDALKSSPAYQNVQSRIATIVGRGTFYIVKGLTAPFKNSEELAERADFAVNDSLGVDIGGTDPFSHPFIEDSDPKYGFTVRPNSVVLGAGGTSAKLNFASLYLRAQKSHGNNTRSFITTGVDAGASLDRLKFNPQSDTYWRSEVGLKMKMFRGNLAFGAGYRHYLNNSYGSNSDKNDGFGLFLVFNKELK